jgi:DNA-binding GntR family transcriptional regulator
MVNIDEPLGRRMKNTRESGRLQVSNHLHPVSRKAIRHIVRDQIREAILSGELKPGEHISETVIAEQLGVSPTPVREAFRELEGARLIVVEPHRGAVVRALTRRDIREMYSLRAHLERMAVKLAIPRMTDDDYTRLARLVEEMVEAARSGDVAGLVDIDVGFHRYICEKADHQLLLETWSNINPSNWTFVTIRTLTERGPLYIAERHWPLLEILRRSDLNAAEEAIAEHIQTIGEEVLQHFRESQTGGDT